MRIKMTSIMVDDQEKALRFYTEVLGFAKRADVPLGAHRWITVVSRDEGANEDLELVLEPDVNPAGKAFQTAMFAQGIPVVVFEAKDLSAEVARLKARGVAFTKEPMNVGPVTIAVFEDTCGNLVQVLQPNG